MKKRFWIIVVAILMFLTSCTKEGKVIDKNRKDELSTEILKKAYDEYCLDFDDLSYENFYESIDVSYSRISDYYFLNINKINIKIFCLSLNNQSLISKGVTKYTSTGKETLTYSSLYKDDKSYYSEYDVYNYDESDNIISRNKKSYWEYTDILSHLTTYEYINNILRKETTLHYDKEGNIDDVFITQYNELEKVILHSQSNYINGETVEYYKHEFEYDKNGNIIGKTFYRRLDGNYIKVLESKTINGKEVETLSVDYTYNDYMPSSKWEFEYDSLGDLVKSTDSTYFNHEWVFDQKREYTKLSDNERMEIVSTFKNGEWILYRKEVDDNFRSEFKTKIVSFYENNEWVLKEKHVYEFDQSTQKKICYHYGYGNNEWVLYSQNEF